MQYSQHKVQDIRIAYIGGGSRGWAWGLMSDLAACDDISGQVALYDIDFQAAKDNEIIGNKFKEAQGARSHWDYTAVKTLDQALTGADFVVSLFFPAPLTRWSLMYMLPKSTEFTSRWEIRRAPAGSSGPCVPFPCSR